MTRGVDAPRELLLPAGVHRRRTRGGGGPRRTRWPTRRARGRRRQPGRRHHDRRRRPASPTWRRSRRTCRSCATSRARRRSPTATRTARSAGTSRRTAAAPSRSRRTLAYFDGVHFAARGQRARAVLGGPGGPDLPAVHGLRRLQRLGARRQGDRGVRLQRPRGRRPLPGGGPAALAGLTALSGPDRMERPRRPGGSWGCGSGPGRRTTWTRSWSCTPRTASTARCRSASRTGAATNSPRTCAGRSPTSGRTTCASRSRWSARTVSPSPSSGCWPRRTRSPRHSRAASSYGSTRPAWPWRPGTTGTPVPDTGAPVHVPPRSPSTGGASRSAARLPSCPTSRYVREAGRPSRPANGGRTTEGPCPSLRCRVTATRGSRPVRTAFEENFRERDELGAAVTVTLAGETVVDLWGGWADAARTRPWERDTLVNVWSTTKGPTALCAHILADRGLLDLDAPVAAYWPEFAAAGKEAVLVRHLLSHRSGLAGLREPHTARRAVRLGADRARLAAQEPWWEPGTRSGYHAITYGFLVGEVVRRVVGAAAGRVPGAGGHRAARASTSPSGCRRRRPARAAELVHPRAAPTSEQAAVFAQLAPVAAGRPAQPAGRRAPRPTRPQWRAAEIPAANGHGTARAVAALYGIFAGRGASDGRADALPGGRRAGPRGPGRLPRPGARRRVRP